MKQKTPFPVLLLAVALALMCSCTHQKVILCHEGEVHSRIVIPTCANEVETRSSLVLQRYLRQITGQVFPIVTDSLPMESNDIHIGKVNRPTIADVDFGKLADDGYLIFTSQQTLNIVGGSKKGTLYGTYAFLERCLGCRKYSSSVKVIPSRFNIELSELHLCEVPAFQFREILYKDAYDPEYMEWHALDQHQSDAYSHGDWGLWCHSVNRLVPPSEYGTAHPEYYALYKGKRLFDPANYRWGDICWTNPEVFEVAKNHLARQIEQHPDLTYWSVSQMDNWLFCECPHCRQAAQQADSPMGAIIPFINRMAQQFPHKIISTLAYQFSTRPPVGIKLEDNVNIMLCNIMSPRHIPIEQGDSAFVADLKAWNKIHHNMLIWDYVIGFDHLIAPFPNLQTLQPNLQFLHKNGVKAMFEQGNRETGGEFCELRAYMLAKLLWNPYQDVDAIINDFVNGFYGPAGEYILRYIRLLQSTVERTHDDLLRRDGPWENRNSFFTEEMIQQYYALLHQAAEAVKYDPVLTVRVMTVRNQIDYAVLDIAKREVTGPRGALHKVNGHWAIRPDISTLLETTMRNCNAVGVTRIHEWSTTPLEYIKEYKQYLERQVHQKL